MSNIQSLFSQAVTHSPQRDPKLKWTQDPHFNKGSAFTRSERNYLGLSSSTGDDFKTLNEQVASAIEELRTTNSQLERYRLLRDLQETNSTLFWALAKAHLAEVLPVIYTPTVGHAIEAQCHLGIPANGVIIRRSDLHSIDTLFARFADRDIRLAVITDGSAVLGLGDQGIGGLAISVGKLNLYSAAAGIAPERTLPIVLDFGTDNLKLRRSPSYQGARHPRPHAARVRAQVQTVVEAFHRHFPNALLQWEDFRKDMAFTLLDDHKERVPSFNDDIQGTGAMALAGFLRAVELKGTSILDERVMIVGAGAGGIGVASMLSQVLSTRPRGSKPQAHVIVLDSRGVVSSRRHIEGYKEQFAVDGAILDAAGTTETAPLPELIAKLGITTLIGLSGKPGLFDSNVVDALLANTERPVVFALSNPGKLCEADPTLVLQHSRGRALVATGSPFGDVAVDGKKVRVAQGNNAFVFPGLGLGALAAGVPHIPETLILRAAQALAGYTAHVGDGTELFPPTAELGALAQVVALEVMAAAAELGIATHDVATDEARRSTLDAMVQRPRYKEIFRADGIHAHM